MGDAVVPPAPPTGRNLLLLGAVFLALLISRKPDVLLHAELWGDDGWSWYPDAYERGVRCLLLPVNGYLNTMQRLVALAVQPLALVFVPTAFAAVALLVQVAPALFLVSPRMAPAWPSAPARLFLATAFLLLPNTLELYGNLTNAQWNLALLAFLVLVAAPPAGRRQAAFDGAVLLLSGLSGPFCLLLAPIAAWQVLARRRRADGWRAALLGITGAIQLGFLASAPHGGRLLAPLGASVKLLLRIVGLQVLLGGELGFGTIVRLGGTTAWQGLILPLTVVLGGLAIGLTAAIRGPALWRQFALFALLVLAGGLASPQVSVTVPQWQAMAMPPMGNRYYSFAILAWAGALLVLANLPTRLPRATGLILLAVLAFWGIPHDWRQLRFPPTDFPARAHAFATAPPGTRMEFPIVPPGNTPMVLFKRAGG